MAEKRCAVVTGGNKGIGFEICRQLANQGIVVVLTARDAEKGIEALEKLKHRDLSSENVVFHQLDVMDSASIATLVGFVKSSFGKLDILVNNAGISGIIFEGDNTLLLQNTVERNVAYALEEHSEPEQKGTQNKANGKLIETCELAEPCLQTNYYGTKRMTEAFIRLLLLSPSPRIVNVSSLLGKVKLISNEWAKGLFSYAEMLTEEKVDDVINEFLKDFKDGSLQAKGWPSELAAYKVSKSSMNAYTRIIANKYQTFQVNCICPGYTRTDITSHTGHITAAEAAESVVKLALLSDDGPSGLFFRQAEPTNF